MNHDKNKNASISSISSVDTRYLVLMWHHKKALKSIFVLILMLPVDIISSAK